MGPFSFTVHCQHLHCTSSDRCRHRLNCDQASWWCLFLWFPIQLVCVVASHLDPQYASWGLHLTMPPLSLPTTQKFSSSSPNFVNFFCANHDLVLRISNKLGERHAQLKSFAVQLLCLSWASRGSNCRYMEWKLVGIQIYMASFTTRYSLVRFQMIEIEKLYSHAYLGMHAPFRIGWG